MKIFISYKFTGIPLEELHEKMDRIVKLLLKYGTPMCNLYNDPFYKINKFTTTQIMEDAINMLKQSQLYVCLADTEIGEGAAIECGYAMALDMPRLLLLKKGIKSVSVKAVSTYIIEFDDIDDLLKKLDYYFESKSVNSTPGQVQ